jgi:hypothetical protein
MTDIVDRLRITHFMDGHEVGVTTQRAEAADEIERLRGLLEPCRPDTDAQVDASYPKTVDDVLSLLSAYICDFMPAESVPGDEYFAAWERQARRVVGPIMEQLAEARAECERLRKRVAYNPWSHHITCAVWNGSAACTCKHLFTNEAAAAGGDRDNSEM